MYLPFSVRSSSSCLRLLPRLLFPSISSSITCFRRQFLRKIWTILAFLRWLWWWLLLSYNNNNNSQVCGTVAWFLFSLNLPVVLFSFASLPLNLPLSFHWSVNIPHSSWTAAKTSSSNAIIFQHYNVPSSNAIIFQHYNVPSDLLLYFVQKF